MKNCLQVKVVIKFVGVKSYSGANEVYVGISSDYETGMKEIREHVKNQSGLKSFLLYRNDISVFDSRNKKEIIRNGDVFKIVPVMSGG